MRERGTNDHAAAHTEVRDRGLLWPQWAMPLHTDGDATGSYGMICCAMDSMVDVMICCYGGLRPKKEFSGLTA